jgi:[acyl-carrier-protein] S-malonyltransferase
MLIPAGEKLAKELETAEIHPIQTPYITNVTADYVTDESQVKDLLKNQISSSVRWQQSVERMIADGVEAFVEIGPKKSLCGFMKKIDKTIPAYHVDTVADLDALCEQLQLED